MKLVKGSDRLVTYKEPKTDWFWRGALYFLLLFFLVLGSSMIVFSLWLWREVTTGWALGLSWLVPLGIFVLWSGWKIWRQFEWKEKHLSSYEMNDQVVRGVTHRPEWDYGVTQEFALKDIVEVTIAPYYIRRMVNAMGPESIRRHGVIIEELGPMLIFRTEKERMEILFDSQTNPKVDEWLRFVQEQGLPLKYTPYRMYWLGNKAISPEDRDDYFKQPSDRIPYEVKGGWMKDEPALYDEWSRVNAGGLRTSMSLKEFEVEEKKKRKWGRWIGIPLGVIFFILLGLYMLGSV